MTADHIDRAAEIIYVEVFGLPDYDPDAVDDHNRHSYRGDCECNASDRVDARHAVEELDAAGLLATPEHDAEVRADERAKVLAGFEVEAAPCGQTKWTPGADPLLKAIECGVPPTKHGDWHNAGGHRWRVTDDLPVLPSRTRLVGPWEPKP